MSRRLVRAIVALALAVVLGAGAVQAGRSGATDGGSGRDAPGPPVDGAVTKVTDGDTIHVRVDGASADVTVRLIGIDTPETKRPDTPIECFGAEASGHLAALLPIGTRVRLEPDVEPTDRYGRTLAYVVRVSDGLFVNLAQVADGYAAPYRYPPNVAHADQISEAGRQASEDGRGLWGACGGPHEAASR